MFDFFLFIQQKFFPDNAKALAVLKGNQNGSAIAGTVRFEQTSLGNPVKVTVNVTGLARGLGTTKHGLHIHQNGITDTSDDLAKSKTWIDLVLVNREKKNKSQKTIRSY